MSKKERIERPLQTIKTNIIPISVNLKVKLANAFQSIVTAIKDKHLS